MSISNLLSYGKKCNYSEYIKATKHPSLFYAIEDDNALILFPNTTQNTSKEILNALSKKKVNIELLDNSSSEYATFLKRFSKSSGPECVICCTNVAKMLVQPCNHLVLCLECNVKLDKCPICRSTITNICKIFF